MKTKRTFGFVSVLAILAAIGGVSAATAQSEPFDAEAYFEGKTIEFVITSNPGGGQDSMTRLLLADFSAYIPGNPRFAITNISDLAGISAVTDAPVSEGQITIGITTRAPTIYLSSQDPNATHDPTEIQLAAGFGTTPNWTMIFNDAAEAYDTFEDAIGSDGPEFVFAETVGDETGVIASVLYIGWLCDTFDLPCRMVNVADANSGTLRQDVARGQINMLDLNAVTGMSYYEDDLRSGAAKVLLAFTEEGTATIEHAYPVPDLRDFLPNEQAAQEFEAMLPVIGYAGMQNVIFAGPDVPAEAVDAIGEAFIEKMRDPVSMERVGPAKFGEFTPDITLFGPDDAQRIYDDAVKTFLENQDTYKIMQAKYYEMYWQ
jgi:tripartite-type tricarboxylate transporter receptor subunit TctC